MTCLMNAYAAIHDQGHMSSRHDASTSEYAVVDDKRATWRHCVMSDASFSFVVVR